MEILLLFRRAALLVPLLCLSLFAQASHFRYGSLSYQTGGANNRVVAFKISEAFREDYFGTPPVVGTVVNTGDVLEFGDGGTAPINLTVTSVGPNYFYGEFNITRTYASSGNFTAVTRDCCRISTLMNNADGNWYVSTLVRAGLPNDSPVSTLQPIVNLAVGQAAASYIVPAGDPNGDVLAYSVATSADLGGVVFVNAPGIAVNSSTGLVTFSTVGRSIGQFFNAVIKITDGSTGTSIVVDHLIQIVGQASAAPVFVYPPTPANGQVFTVAPGAPVNFTVRATDSDAGDVVALSALGLPGGSTFVPANGNPANGTFAFTPTVANLGSTIVISFLAQDNSGTQASTSVTIQVQQGTTCNPTANSPVANPDNFNTLCGPVVITNAQLLSNDTDPLSRPLAVNSISALSNPASGTLATGPAGTYTFTPAPGFTGTTTFTYLLQLAGPVFPVVSTGHYYEFVSAPGICWTAAQAAAAAKTYNGLPGYLATVTTPAENAVLTAMVGPGNYWFGASDAAVEGEWRWVTGPEAGTQFWQGNASGSIIPGQYANWDGGEPNDFQPTGEDYGQIFGMSGKWNDLANCGNVNYGLGGYLVEYGGFQGECLPILFATGTVTITVPAPVAVPVANPDMFTVACSSLAITDAQLLANDTDPLSRPLAVASVSSVTNGTLVTGPAGTYTYTPTPGFTGTATFTYVLQVAGPVFPVPATGHYYEFVSDPKTCWTAANAAAATRTYGGLQGYLATLTSAVENAAVTGRVSGNYWFGASDAASEGQWRWVTGPEAGTQFWQSTNTNPNAVNTGGATLPGQYSNWDGGEPNNFQPGGEGYAHLFGSTGKWNDLADCSNVNYPIAGYLVEYGGLERCNPVYYSIGTVTIMVGSQAPVCAADVFNTTGAPVAITSAQLLANDSDPLSRPLQVTGVTAPTSGTLTPGPVGTYTYTPAPGFSGTATFSYTLQLAGPVVAYPGNGHYYEFVSAPGTCWTAALAAAAAKTYNGMPGYLATLTSAGENAFVTGQQPGNFWIGAADNLVEGEWRWKSGPEAGQLFWQGNATGTAVQYANWDGGEPNDFQPTGEDFGHIYGMSGKWNDLANCGNSNYGLGGYLVEYGGLGNCTPVLFSTCTVSINVRPASTPIMMTPMRGNKAVLEAAPNPSNGPFSVRVVAAVDGDTKLDLYDLQGRRISSIFEGSLQAGEQRELSVNVPDLASGMYTVRMQSGKTVQHVRVVVQK